VQCGPVSATGGRLRKRALLATLLAAGACGQDATLPEGALEPVKVGVVTSLTGDLASLGPGWRDAALLAEQEANAAGGPLPGRRVEFVIADDQTDPTQAGRAAEELIFDDGVVAIIGSAGSSASLQVAAVAGPARVPQVSCCSTSPDLTTAQPSGDRYLFRTVPSDELQAKVLARSAAERFGCMRLAVMHLDDNYGSPFGEAISQTFQAIGRSVVIEQPFANGRSSYASEVRAVADANPDCIAIVGFPESAGTIVRDWNSMSMPPAVQWIGTDGVRSDGFVDAAGNPDWVDGFVGTAPMDRASGSRTRFVYLYQETFASDPVIFGTSQYDAAALVMLAIARAGSTDGAAIRDALYTVSRPNADTSDTPIGAGELRTGFATIRAGGAVDYDGASGPVDLDELGNVRGDYELWRYDSAAGFERIDTILAEDIP